MVVIKLRFHKTPKQRIHMFKNLTKNLIDHERIVTTVNRAKILRPFVEKMIALGKGGTLHHRRRAFDYMTDSRLVHKVFTTLAERYKNRTGGFTRIQKILKRRSDSARMAYIELVDNKLPWQFAELRYVKLNTLRQQKLEKEKAQENNSPTTEKNPISSLD